MKRNKSKIVSIFALTVLFIATLFAFSTNATDESIYDFANFTEADSMAFVEEHNIEIPEKLQQSDYLSVFTKELILQSYEAPNIPFCFNYYETQTYAEDIRETVRMYFDLAAMPSVASYTPYNLQHSKVMDVNGNWVAEGGTFNYKWLDYNCYAYSINRAEQPSFYDTGRQYRPGDMSSAGIFQDCSNINQLAEIVRADLVAMGYSNISLSSSIPTINSSQELICVRMLYDVDCHFMRYDAATDSWYHKPGLTAVLKYNYTPSTNYTWSTEFSYAGTEYPSTFEYNSDIVFITYSKNVISVDQNSTSREYIQPGKDVFCEMNINSAGHYDINLVSDYSIEYEIYNEDFDIISSGNGAAIDTCLDIDTAGKYYLRMNFVSYSNIHYVDVSAAPHSHSYTESHVWHSYTQHTSTCCCGESCLNAHVIAAGSISGTNQYTRCLRCGGLASMGMIGALSVNGLPHSSNGSYILPNGNIVLVPEDIDAYMNETLVFAIGEIE